MEILAPEDRVFHSPNEITEQDFDGWVQERGLYFMDQWDEHFKPLLSSHDPGEPPRRAGCCGRSMARGLTFTRDMHSSGSCRLGCRERCGLYVNLLSCDSRRRWSSIEGLPQSPAFR